MKQLKITKRQAALMLLELCHGFCLICHLCVCSGNIRAWKRTVCTGGMSAVSAKCRPVSGEKKATLSGSSGIVTLLLIGGSVMLAGSGVWRNLDRNSGSCCGIFLFLWEGIKENLLVEDSVVSMAWNCSGSVFSWSAFCVGYGDSDCSGSCSIILSAL